MLTEISLDDDQKPDKQGQNTTSYDRFDKNIPAQDHEPKLPDSEKGAQNNNTDKCVKKSFVHDVISLSS